MPGLAVDARILVIEDDPIQVELLRHHLGGGDDCTVALPGDTSGRTSGAQHSLLRASVCLTCSSDTAGSGRRIVLRRRPTPRRS